MRNDTEFTICIKRPGIRFKHGYKPSGKAKFLYLPKVGIRAVQTLSRTKQNTKNVILFLDFGAAKYKTIQYFILSYIDNQFNSCRKDNILNRKKQ